MNICPSTVEDFCVSKGVAHETCGSQRLIFKRTCRNLPLPGTSRISHTTQAGLCQGAAEDMHVPSSLSKSEGNF